MKLVKRYPFSVCFALLYTIVWAVIFLIPLRHPAGDIAIGEASVFAVFLGYFVATISVITTISLAIVKREYMFYSYLSAFILLPVFIALILTYT